MKTLTIDKYTVEIEVRDRWFYLVRVYEEMNFLGKMISNDIEEAFKTIINK